MLHLRSPLLWVIFLLIVYGATSAIAKLFEKGVAAHPDFIGMKTVA